MRLPSPPAAVVLFSLVLIAAVAREAKSQRPGPDQMYNCWGCMYYGGGFMQGWRCFSGMPNGGTGCREWSEGEQYVCVIDGEGECEPGFTGDSLDVALVSDGETVETVRRLSPGLYASGDCSSRRMFYLDSDGLVLGVVVGPARPQSQVAVNPTRQ